MEETMNAKQKQLIYERATGVYDFNYMTFWKGETMSKWKVVSSSPEEAWLRELRCSESSENTFKDTVKVDECPAHLPKPTRWHNHQVNPITEL